MAQLNGVLMALITGSRLLTSVEQDSCVVALKPKKATKGNFWEKSNSASSYRAEQLGVRAIHHVISALTTFYKLENCTTKV